MAPRDKKRNNFSSDDADLKMKKGFFKRLYPGFKKKANELSVLCGNSVGFICHGPDNDLHVWPEPQDNPHALTHIVAKFDALSDHKRKLHACDLYDFPNCKGLSGDDLRIHLDNLNSHLLGIRQKKLAIVKKTLRGSTDEDRARVSENTAISDQKLKVEIETNSKDMVSGDHLRVSDQKLASWEDQSSTKLGFGGVFDELGYVIRGSTNLGKTVSESKDAGDMGMEADYTGLDPITLGFCGGDYLQATELYPILPTYNLEFYSPTPPPLPLNYYYIG